jgi:DNA repair exonuclease SbcCD ATPase subunit
MEEEGQLYVEKEDGDEKHLGNRFMKFIVRLFFVILVGIGVGAGVYYGIPALYRDFIHPIQTNTLRVAALESELANVQVEIRENQAVFSKRLADVEGEVAAQREDIAALNAHSDGLDARLGGFESDLDGIQSLSEKLQVLAGDLDGLSERLNVLELAIAAEDPPIKEIQKHIQLLRVMELVTRARMWIIQDNPGKAKDDLVIAKAALETTDASLEDGSLSKLIDRLDQIIFEIPLSPVIAADDLEILWQLLILATGP